MSPPPCSSLQGRGAQSQPPEGELLLRAPRYTHRHSGHRPKKEDWLQKKDCTQRRPGRRRTKTDRVGELPPRAPPRPPPPTSLTDRPLTDTPTSTRIVADTPTSTSKMADTPTSISIKADPTTSTSIMADRAYRNTLGQKAAGLPPPVFGWFYPGHSGFHPTFKRKISLS